MAERKEPHGTHTGKFSCLVLSVALLKILARIFTIYFYIVAKITSCKGRFGNKVWKKYFTASVKCLSTFFLLKRTPGFIVPAQWSVIRNHLTSSELHNFFFFLICQKMTNESNQLINFSQNISPTWSLQNPNWQNTQKVSKSQVLLSALR